MEKRRCYEKLQTAVKSSPGWNISNHLDWRVYLDSILTQQCDYNLEGAVFLGLKGSCNETLLE